MGDYISDTLKEICKIKGKTCYQLSRETNISTSSLYSILNGVSSPRVSTLEIICKALGIGLSDFFLTVDKRMEKGDYQNNLLNIYGEKVSLLNPQNQELLREFVELLLKYQIQKDAL